jgi:hypothetical protein
MYCKAEMKRKKESFPRACDFPSALKKNKNIQFQLS